MIEQISPSTVTVLLSALTPSRRSSGYSSPVVTVPGMLKYVDWLFMIAQDWDWINESINWKNVAENTETVDLLSGDWVSFGKFELRFIWDKKHPVDVLLKGERVDLNFNVVVRGTGWLTQFFSYKVTGLSCDKEGADVHSSGLGNRWVIPRLVWGE